jgi:predicted nucleic acid-binding protein
MTAPQMRELLLAYAELPLQRHRHLRLVGRAFELRDNFAPADSFYVALAERLEAPLLTADRRLARATRQRTPIEVLP